MSRLIDLIEQAKKRQNMQHLFPERTVNIASSAMNAVLPSCTPHEQSDTLDDTEALLGELEQMVMSASVHGESCPSALVSELESIAVLLST